MQKKDNKNSMFEMCPVRNVIARFGNKWGFLVLLDINEHGTIRFNELHRVIPLIVRKVYPEIPPRVEYSLTPMGKELVPIVQELTAWASKNLPTIMKHRQQFEE